MYFGVSKRIGKGLRIGTAINTKNWDRDDGDGTTAADRRSATRESFLSGLKYRMDNAITDAALSSGYLATPEEFLSLHLLLTSKLRPLADEFYLQHRLAVDDGSPLTTRKKDDMLKVVYAAEEMVKAINPVHPLKKLKADYEGIAGKYKKWIFFMFVWILIGSICVANDQSGWWFSPVALCLFFWVLDGSRSHHRKRLMMAAAIDVKSARGITAEQGAS